MKKNFLLIGLVGLLFVGLMAVGFNLARHKPLWGDEIYSQVVNIHNLSYGEILLGPRGEGNACPLFYVLQKAVGQISGYHTPVPWLQGERQESWDPVSQRILRINPVFFMSLAVCLIFYYFSRYHSFLTGVYALGLSLSSYMVWLYWAEARHYALWVFLTVSQSLLFLSLLRTPQARATLWRWLIGVHILLSFTVILSLGQILAVSFLLWWFKERDPKRYVCLAGLPFLVCAYYYFRAPKTRFIVPEDALRFIYPCLPGDQLLICGLFAVFLFFLYLQKQGRVPVLLRETKGEGKVYLIFMVLMLAAALILLGIFKLRAPTAGPGQDISMRYFIFLTPVGVIAATLFADGLVRAFDKNVWMQINLIIGFIGLMTISFLRHCFWVIGIY